MQPSLPPTQQCRLEASTTKQAGRLCYEISACAVGEMFLIKRPFSQGAAIKRRYTYGKATQKEEFY
jgi:hypothetical protein